ncbi:UNVERIFIED_CONTAM: hypothetical protein FKN15_014596 [Acipenser sinensis]
MPPWPFKRDVACSICEAFQPRVKEARLERATRASSVSSMARPVPGPPARHPRCTGRPQSLIISKQTRDIMDLKAQMAQVLELLTKQAPAAQAPVQGLLRPQLPYPPSPRGVQGGWEEDTPSIAASGEEASFS